MPEDKRQESKRQESKRKNIKSKNIEAGILSRAGEAAYDNCKDRRKFIIYV